MSYVQHICYPIMNANHVCLSVSIIISDNLTRFCGNKWSSPMRYKYLKVQWPLLKANIKCYNFYNNQKRWMTTSGLAPLLSPLTVTTKL